MLPPTRGRAALVFMLAALACETPPSPCGPALCSGCCDDTGVCEPGTTPAACGEAGGTCATCSANETCLVGACVAASSGGGAAEGGGSAAGGGAGATGGGTAQASCAASCNGCCETDGGCSAGNERTACGQNGAACAPCTGADSCEAGQCHACAGCISPTTGTCEVGTTSGECGAGGATCESCFSGERCLEGRCLLADGGIPSCDGVTLCNGCCDSLNMCHPGTEDTGCSFEAHPCVACAITDLTCVAHSCR